MTWRSLSLQPNARATNARWDEDDTGFLQRLDDLLGALQIDLSVALREFGTPDGQYMHFGDICTACARQFTPGRGPHEVAPPSDHEG